MAIKNLSLQTIGLHVGFKDYSKLYPSQIPYTEAGVLTNSGVSIFGEGQSLPGDLATVLIGPPNPQSGVKHYEYCQDIFYELKDNINKPKTDYDKCLNIECFHWTSN